MNRYGTGHDWIDERFGNYRELQAEATGIDFGVGGGGDDSQGGYDFESDAAEERGCLIALVLVPVYQRRNVTVLPWC